MASAVRIRYVYETSFFDGRPGWTQQPDQQHPTDQVDSAINHPIVRRIQQAVIRARKAVASAGSASSHHNTDTMAQSDDDEATTANQHNRSGESSLQTSMCSLDVEELGEDGRFVLNRSRSLQQTHLLHSSSSEHHRGFSLHLSPKQRTSRIGEAVLSPISDKSENETSQMLSCTGAAVAPSSSALATSEFNATSIPRRRPQSLFPSIINNRPVGSAAFNSSDSGISISANSLSSHETLQQPHKPTHLSLNNSHEFLSSSSSEPPEESLPFLMPKLRRGGGANAGFGGQPKGPSGPVRQLSLTLPFPPPLQSLPFVAPAIGFKDLVDETIPLDIQSWYHGSITRRDAEKRLRPAPAGSFLVRDSLASHDDYFLAARGENGFLHVRIIANVSCDDPSIIEDFTLATLPDRRFESVAAAVNHCANIGVYCRQLPPVVFKYPLAEEPV